MRLTFCLPVLIIILSSCSNNLDARLQLISNSLNVNLPSNFEVIEDKDITISYIPSEYDLLLTLKFEDESLDTLLHQIHQTPYFNKLGQFKYRDKYNLASDEFIPLKIAMDSLVKTRFRGTWFTTKNGYEFYDLSGPETMELIDAWIDFNTKTLTYKYQKL